MAVPGPRQMARVITTLVLPPPFIPQPCPWTNGIHPLMPLAQLLNFCARAELHLLPEWYLPIFGNPNLAFPLDAHQVLVLARERKYF